MVWYSDSGLHWPTRKRKQLLALGTLKSILYLIDQKYLSPHLFIIKLPPLDHWHVIFDSYVMFDVLITTQLLAISVNIPI